MFVCHSCGAQVTLGEPIPRDAECESCGVDLRSCLNCRHYDPRYNNACTETQADPVTEKRRRNFCEYFYYSREAFTPAASSTREAEARAKLDAMFGGAGASPGEPEQKLRDLFAGGAKSKDDREADARKRLEGLFGEKKDES